MSKLVVLCEAEGCESENSDYEYKNGTYWFTCTVCNSENEIVESGWL